MEDLVNLFLVLAVIAGVAFTVNYFVQRNKKDSNSGSGSGGGGSRNIDDRPQRK